MSMNHTDSIRLAKSLTDLIPSDIDWLVKLCEDKYHLEGCIVELGAFKGGATIAMAKTSNRQVYSFDVFGGLPYNIHSAFDKFGNVTKEEVETNTCKFPNITLVQGLHEDTVPLFPPQPVMMVFMDSDWYDSHIVGLTNLWPMVVNEGVIVFHDWLFEDVQRAITDCIDPKDCSYFGRLPESNMGMIQKIDLK
jgi:hypothetical protein